MAFDNILFLFVFLTVFFTVYYFAGKTKYRNYILVAFSILFYSWASIPMVFVMLASVCVNYLISIGIAENLGRKKAKTLVTAAVIFNIAFLAVFKYTAFIFENINGIFGSSIEVPSIAVPLGVSYFTFKSISYVVDVYWEKVTVQRKFHKLLMYIAMFPQIVAGPIGRYENIESDINERKITLTDISEGVTRVVFGIAKKVLVANILYTIATNLYSPDSLADATVLGSWISIIAYSLYIYYEFMGLSDIAVGLGRMMGFKLEENFNYPFMCGNVAEFWQRWHMSLGSFFRDYLLYIPIFGKRRKYGSLLLVWLTTGIWHGASWNFIIWGLYFGAFILIETLIGKKRLKKVPSTIMHVYNKLVIILGFGIFRFGTLGDMGNFFGTVFGISGAPFFSKLARQSLAEYVYVLIFALIFCFPIIKKLKEFVASKSYAIRAAGQVCIAAADVGVLGLSTVALIATSLADNPFLYMNF